MDQSANIGSRRSRRSNVLLAATIEAGGATIPVKLRNLSAYGALIIGESLPDEGSPVLFRRNDLSVSGRIAWVRKDHAGVGFDAELQPQEVLRHIPKPVRKPQPDHRRPGLSSRPLTPAEEQFIEQWFWSPAKGPLGQ